MIDRVRLGDDEVRGSLGLDPGRRTEKWRIDGDQGRLVAVALFV
jgi:hypothetical protein